MEKISRHVFQKGRKVLMLLIYFPFSFYRNPQNPPFPTYYPEDRKEPLPEEEYAEDLYNFNNPTIRFSASKKK